MTRHRQEALDAITTARTLLAGGALSELDRKLAVATLDHALEHLALVEELKQPRRAKPAPEGATA